MKFYLLFYLIFIVLFKSSSFCQAFEKIELNNNYLQKSKLDSNYIWNPIQVGNKWQFVNAGGEVYNKEVLYDTLINNLLYSFVTGGQKANSYFERNEKNLAYLYDLENLDDDSTTQELLLENFDSPIGSSFYSYRYKFLTDDSLQFKIIDRFWAYVYLYDDTVFALTYEVWDDSWLTSTDTWAQKYGLVHMEGEGSTLFLSGAVINSVQYGEIVSVEETEIITVPDNIRLLGNYPNPFNNRTIIAIVCNKPTTFSFEVYNVLGQLLKTYKYSTPVMGNQKITFNSFDKNGNALTSGVYIYKINSPLQQLTGKMILLK